MKRSDSTPEFDGWRWVSYWYPVRQVVSFKRDVYRRVMKEFVPTVMGLQPQVNQVKPNYTNKRRRNN